MKNKTFVWSSIFSSVFYSQFRLGRLIQLVFDVIKVVSLVKQPHIFPARTSLQSIGSSHKKNGRPQPSGYH